MASSNINASPRRWENGGTIKIISGADDYSILNVEQGVIELVEPTREAVEYKDRGVQQQPLEGDDIMGSLKVDVKSGSFVGATSLRGLLLAAGSSGLVKEYSIEIKVPGSRGDATGESLTCTNCFHDRNSPTSIRFGGPGALDIRSFMMRIRGTVTAAAY